MTRSTPMGATSSLSSSTRSRSSRPRRTRFAVCSLNTRMPTASSPLTRNDDCRGAKPSDTSLTCLSCTGRLGVMRVSPNATRFDGLPSTMTSSRPASESRLPTWRTLPARWATASMTWAGVTPVAAARARSTLTINRRCDPPVGLASPTPDTAARRVPRAGKRGRRGCPGPRRPGRGFASQDCRTGRIPTPSN